MSYHSGQTLLHATECQRILSDVEPSHPSVLHDQGDQDLPNPMKILSCESPLQPGNKNGNKKIKFENCICSYFTALLTGLILTSFLGIATKCENNASIPTELEKCFSNCSL
jgi:hypothetical protein